MLFVFSEEERYRKSRRSANRRSFTASRSAAQLASVHDDTDVMNELRITKQVSIL